MRCVRTAPLTSPLCSLRSFFPRRYEARGSHAVGSRRTRTPPILPRSGNGRATRGWEGRPEERRSLSHDIKRGFAWKQSEMRGARLRLHRHQMDRGCCALVLGSNTMLGTRVAVSNSRLFVYSGRSVPNKSIFGPGVTCGALMVTRRRR